MRVDRGDYETYRENWRGVSSDSFAVHARYRIVLVDGWSGEEKSYSLLARLNDLFFIWYYIYICAISWAAEVVKKIWELINRYLFICYQTCWKMLEELEEIWIAFGDNSFWKCWMFEKNFCEIILLRILEIFCVVLFYEKRINASYIFYDNLKYFLRIILNNLQKNFCKSFSLLFRESLSK